MTSLLPLVSATSIKKSSTRKSIAMMPLARGREKSDKAVFLTTPLLVANTTNSVSVYSRTVSTALTRSFSSKGRRLTIGLPRELRLATGNS